MGQIRHRRRQEFPVDEPKILPRPRTDDEERRKDASLAPPLFPSRARAVALIALVIAGIAWLFRRIIFSGPYAPYAFYPYRIISISVLSRARDRGPARFRLAARRVATACVGIGMTSARRSPGRSLKMHRHHRHRHRRADFIGESETANAPRRGVQLEMPRKPWSACSV